MDIRRGGSPPAEGKAIMRGLYTRNGIFWARFKVRGIEYRESLRTRSRSVAERRLKAVRQEVEDRAYFGAAEAVSWPAAVIAWDEAIKRSGKRPATMARYLMSLAQLRPWLDAREVQRIDMDLLREIVRTRRKLVSNATVRRDLTAISSVLDHAIDEGWIEENPARMFDRRRLSETRDPITLPQPSAIEAVLSLASRFTDMAAFARETGMREEEIASLHHAQVDRDRMSASLTYTKGRRAREVPLSEAALEIIDRQPQFLRSPFVFWRGAGERFINVASQFHATMKRAARNAAQPIARFRFHDLRHLFAVEYLRQRRGSIYALQQVLGHRSIKTTEQYLEYLTPEERLVAMHGVVQNAAQDHRSGADNAG
jgi:integrase/recombinase XerD